MYRPKTYISIFASLVFGFGVSLCGDTNLYDNPDGYLIETMETPPGRPFHVSGLDTNAEGHLFAATRMGEVWRWDGETWTQFAEGLQEPCGLLCEEDGSVVVAQKPELTRLVDLDRDGHADRYETLTRGFTFFGTYHEFHYGPVKDSLGNYFCSLNLSTIAHGGVIPNRMSSHGGYRGWVYRLSPEREFFPHACGLRSPAGIGIGPGDRIFVTDNQGDWVGTSKLDEIKEDHFYGHPSSLFQKEGYPVEKVKNMGPEDLQKIRTLPVVWIPHLEVANSPGNPEFNLTNGKFGPFDGQIFVGDHTTSSIFRISLQEVRGETQGAVINFMRGFQSGVIRLKFDQTGNLWVGETSRGWPTRGDQLFGLQRVSWDGTTPFEIQDMKLTGKGFKVSLTAPINNKDFDKDSIGLQSWWYEYHADYGSPKIDLREVPVKAVRVEDGGRTLYIECPLEKLNVYGLTFERLLDEQGRALANPMAYYTLKELL